MFICCIPCVSLMCNWLEQDNVNNWHFSSAKFWPFKNAANYNGTFHWQCMVTSHKWLVCMFTLCRATFGCSRGVKCKKKKNLDLCSEQGILEKTCYLSVTRPVKAISPYCSAPRHSQLCVQTRVYVCKILHKSTLTGPAYQWTRSAVWLCLP